jgi:hypothetical protein
MKFETYRAIKFNTGVDISELLEFINSFLSKNNKPLFSSDHLNILSSRQPILTQFGMLSLDMVLETVLNYYEYNNLNLNYLYDKKGNLIQIYEQTTNDLV